MGVEERGELVGGQDPDAKVVGFWAFDPAPSPTTTRSVRLDTEPDALPPRRST